MVKVVVHTRSSWLVTQRIKIERVVQTRGREAAVGMAWEDFKVLLMEEFCPNNEMQKLKTKFWCHAMVGASHAAYTNQLHELARLVPHLVTPENKRIERYIYGLVLQICGMVAATEPKTIQSAILKAGMLTDEAIRNGALKKNTEKRRNNREPSRDGNDINDNKRSKTGRAFATITNTARKEYTGTNPYAQTATITIYPRNPTAARGACLECGGTDHYKATCSRDGMVVLAQGRDRLPREENFPPSMVTKLRNKITNFRQRPDESLFEAWEHYKLLIDRCPNHNMLPVTQIDSFYNELTLRHHDTINAATGGTFMKRLPEECYDLIKNMTAHHNDWDTSV
nr:reverse transcriptase domain-containing protein [Tanacetum cinerariifolium]